MPTLRLPRKMITTVSLAIKSIIVPFAKGHLILCLDSATALLEEPVIRPFKENKKL